MEFNIGDQVFVKTNNTLGTITNKVQVENTIYYQLDHELKQAYSEEQLSSVTKHPENPIPLDISTPIAHKVATEEYVYDKDDRDEEFKQQVLQDANGDKFVVLELEEFKEIVEKLQAVQELLAEAEKNEIQVEDENDEN